jgi:hypothetical protein
MIETRHTLNVVKRFRRMTFTAVLPEFILVRVGVTVDATREPDPGKLSERFPVFCRRRMAFQAFHCLMLARQRVLR